MTNHRRHALRATPGECRASIGLWASLLAGLLGSAAAAAPIGHFQTLHEFDLDASPQEGILPTDQLVLGPDGRMYGTNLHGGAHGFGTAFRLRNAGQPEVLFSFGGSGSRMVDPGGLMAADDGFFYGVIQGGHDRGFGAIYRMSTSGTVKELVDFTGKRCTKPVGRLIQASDGSLYGTTSNGGANFLGCLFRMTLDGRYTSLRSLGDMDGVFPRAALLQASDGAIYGTLPYGGPKDGGTIFRMSLAGAFEVVHAFERPAHGLTAGGPFVPQSALVEVGEDWLVGTTSDGGAAGFGTIYRFHPGSGELVVMHEFTGASDGGEPRGDLRLARDGWLYGVNLKGGAKGQGVIYRMALDGRFETLHDVRPGRKQGPAGIGLLETGDGEFYGVTTGGGADGVGTVYRLRLR